MSARDVHDLAYGDARDSFDYREAGRTHSGPVTAATSGRAAEALRLVIEARIALWRHEAEPDTEDDGDDRAGRDAIRMCANELATDLRTWEEQARDFAAASRAARWCGVHRPHPEHDWTSLSDESFRCAPADETFGTQPPQPQPAPASATLPCGCDERHHYRADINQA